MNNGWLKFLVPKVWVKVETLADVARMRADHVKIYGIRRTEDGYIVSIRRDTNHGLPVVGRQSIYGFLLSFALPIAFVWAMLLVAIQFITIDYEIRGNLTPEDVQMVDAHIASHFMHIGPFAFLRTGNEALVEDLHTVFHDYIWINAKSYGSRLMIDIFDTQMIDTSSEDEQVDTLYAKASGVVTHIDVTGCLVLVEPNQVVHKGDPLISCFTPTGWSEEVAPIDSVATGSIYANVWYEVEIKFPREYTAQILTTNSSSAWFLNIGERKVNLWGRSVDFEDFEMRSRVYNPLDIFNLSPISLERVHYYEKSDIILNNEVDYIRTLSDQLVENELTELIEGEFEVVNLEFLALDESDEMVRLVYHATVTEDIAISR